MDGLFGWFPRAVLTEGGGVAGPRGGRKLARLAGCYDVHRSAGAERSRLRRFLIRRLPAPNKTSAGIRTEYGCLLLINL